MGIGPSFAIASRESVVSTTAEGATAPETLRQMDRLAGKRWKAAGWLEDQRAAPKEQVGNHRERAGRRNLSGTKTAGASVPAGQQARQTCSGWCHGRSRYSQAYTAL